MNAGDYDSIRSMIDNALKAGQDKNMGHEYNKDVESRYREDHRSVVPTPWEAINELLQGGLGNGDFMNKEFTKADLKDGMVGATREGKR